MIDIDKSFVLFAECSVKYEGRTRSTVLDGNRLIIKKPDNTLLIHKAKGIPPLNYNRSKDIQFVNNTIISNGKERIEILVIKIHSITYLDDWSFDNINLYGSESDYKKYLIKNMSKFIDYKEIIEEYDTGVGKIDLCVIDKNDYKHFIEIKRKRATINAVYQLLRYTKNSECYTGYIAAPSINQKAAVELEVYKFKFIELKLSQF